MRASTTWFLWAGSVLSVAGTARVLHLTLARGMTPAAGVFADYEARLSRHTTFLMSAIRGSQVARAQLFTVASSLVLWAATRQILLLVLALIAALAPQAVLQKRHVARVQKLEAQLDAWLLMLANALKATSSVVDALASTVVLAPRPFRDELDLLVKEIRLGMPLDRALQSTGRRIGSGMISGALAAIIVARKTGGDLPRTLERAAAALRESARLEAVLRAKTAEGRGQVLVLAAAPFLLCSIISWLDPNWFTPMLERTYGRAILAACALSWLVAVVWSHHIVRTDL